MSSRKFAQIKVSIQEVGLIEPLSVAKPDPYKEEFLLLDDHMRVLVLKEMGETEAPCLLAKNDESYTYNNRINRLSTIQEHYMLRRAIDRGVSKERLARTFNLDISSIDKRVNLLEGVTAGAVVLLRDQQFNPEVARVLRKMRPERQVEAVELMIAANAITVIYAEALLTATHPEQLTDNRPPKLKLAVTPRIDFTKLFSPLSLPELQQAQTLLSHAMDKRREQERDRLFEEFAALARARGIAIHEVVRRTHGHAPPPKRGTAKRVRRPAPIKFRHPDQKDLTWTGRGKTPTWVNAWVKQGRTLAELNVFAA